MCRYRYFRACKHLKPEVLLVTNVLAVHTNDHEKLQQTGKFLEGFYFIVGLSYLPDLAYYAEAEKLYKQNLQIVSSLFSLDHSAVAEAKYTYFYICWLLFKGRFRLPLQVTSQVIHNYTVVMHNNSSTVQI